MGAVTGIQESTLRAAVGDLSASTARATAYGVFNTAYGVALLISGIALGALYNLSIPTLVAMIVLSQIAASIVLRTLLAAPNAVPPDNP